MSFARIPAAERLVCLDIETVPDRSRLPGDWAGGFPKTLHHRVVCVSVVEADIAVDADGHERYAFAACRTGGEAGWDEARLLKAFWSYFAGRPTRLVTWNGRSFDLPVLVQRTMVHGLVARGFFDAASRFDSFSYRFATERHCDVMDALADHGASARLGLDETAAAVGLPGKIGGHGSEVEAMVEAGEERKVRDYCESDVLNLFGVYARYRLLTGRTTMDGYRAALDGMAAYLDRERGSRPHLGEFLDRWGASEPLVPILDARRSVDGDGAER